MVVMNAYQLDNIYSSLSVWRNKRKLTSAQQRKGYVANVLEELIEYMKAENEYERVDALCDILVFSFNATGDCYSNSNIYRNIRYDLEQDLLVWLTNLTHVKLDNTELFSSYVAEIVRLALTKLYDMSYDAYLCMSETIKEIESRRGSWNEDAKKWIKDTSPEAQVEWYKANYEYCKLNSNDIDKH